jgi:AraC-like DNA-binding protein
MGTIFTIGIFLSFFLQFLLLAKPDKSTSDKILAVWMFVAGIHLFSFFMGQQGYWVLYPSLAGLHHPLPLLHGPLLYLYVVYSLRTDQRFGLINYIHFLPPLGFYLYMIPFFFQYSTEERALINSGAMDDYATFIAFSLVAFLISGIGYAVASYRLLNRYQDITKQNFAYKESIDLNWLKHFIIGMGVIFGIAILLAVLQEWVGVQFGFNTDIIFYSLIILFIFYLGYSGIIHQGIFSTSNAPVAIVEEDTKDSYKRSGLKESDAKLYHEKLMTIMKKEKPYLEPKLSLVGLAEHLDISPNHLSQIINQCEDKNFYDFVNHYRVEEFKKRVLDPENSNFSLLAIAYDSGFNSKSSFNDVFKKTVGKTPTQYLHSKKES